MRLLDNQALSYALDLCHTHQQMLVPIMGLETDLIEDEITQYEFSDMASFGYLSSMIPLYQNYRHFGMSPLIFQDSIINFLHQIHSTSTIHYLVTHQEHGTNGTYQRDKNVAKWCRENGITWYQIQPSIVTRNLQSRDHISKEYLQVPALPIPNFEQLHDVREALSLQIVQKSAETLQLLIMKKDSITGDHILYDCSEKAGLNILKSFVTTRAAGYRGGISSPNTAITNGSRLSQCLALGSLSIRYVHQYFWKCIKSTDNKKLKSGMLGAMQRLHWREHFIQRIETDPSMPNRAIHPDFNTIPYTHLPQLFESFTNGTTGEVLVDACIRCLHTTGFINFRMRAMLVSYGVFGLDLDWRELGKYLATQFLDYEPGIHWSQIQMQAGVTGINTIRVYSPHKQLLDQDPECVFVRKWIPEIDNLTNSQILDYPHTSLSLLTNGTYPDPVVDFKTACKLNKAKTFQIKKLATKETSQCVFVRHGSRKKSTKKTTSKK
jgi:deoxyribodipyrimidine photo-lyase